MRKLFTAAADAVGTLLLVVGIIGFMVCWQISWNTHERVLGTGQFDRPTAAHPSSIEVKGRTFFVEPSYARRFRLADNLINRFWGLGAAGITVLSRKEIAAWWKRRRIKSPLIGFSSNQPQPVQAAKPDDENVVRLGFVICAGLFLFWGILPALIGSVALIIWLICARVLERS